MTATPPRPPLNLPAYTFIMSDHTTRQLAGDIATAINVRNHEVYIDNFLTPIYTAYEALFDDCVMVDLFIAEAGVSPLQSEHHKTVRDIIVSLEKWFIEQFGLGVLGALAYQRAEANRQDFRYSYVFRDATVEHVKGFGETPPRDKMFIWLEHSHIFYINETVPVLSPAVDSWIEAIERITK